jgi:hypothetical protein
MSQEQVPQMSTSLRGEGEPSNTAKVGSEMDDTEIKLKPPLVSEADLARMRVQIDGVFKDSSVIPEKSGDWEAETGTRKQVAKIAPKLAWFGLTHLLLMGKGLSEVLKDKKQRSQEKNIKSTDATPQF